MLRVWLMLWIKNFKFLLSNEVAINYICLKGFDTRFEPSLP